ncbi:MAG: endolytic transglycosylase MltG [Ktedonobacteraceae bacterium]
MRQPRSRAAIIAVLLVGILIFGFVLYIWNTTSDIFQPIPGPIKNVPVTIQPGETTAEIGDDLQNKGIIRNALAFRIWARIKGLDTKLEAGVYKKINSGMTISQVIDTLQQATPDEILVKIIEGYRLEQIANATAATNLPNFKKADFLKYTKHVDQFPDTGKYPLLFKDLPQGASMEGLLFPDTYSVPADGTARDVVNVMLKAMSDKIKLEHLDQQAAQHQLSIYQVLTLASIVEREAGKPQDRGNIASVYWNRLYTDNGKNQTGGRLQADPTVQYARDTQNPPARYWAPLQDVGSNIAADSNWNTYVKQGLPPTPICSPGIQSLIVAANPPKTDYLYFFAKKDGFSVFTATYTDFQQKQKQFGVNN